MSYEEKETPQPKLLETTSKAVKIEMVRRTEAEKAKEEAAKQRPVRVQRKSSNFLVKREEVLAAALVEALPVEIRSATESFYKFWMDRWQCTPLPVT